jgi:hypothetical protein
MYRRTYSYSFLILVFEIYLNNHGTKEFTYLVKTDIARELKALAVLLKNGVKLNISIIFFLIQIFIYIYIHT